MLTKARVVNSIMQSLLRIYQILQKKEENKRQLHSSMVGIRLTFNSSFTIYKGSMVTCTKKEEGRGRKGRQVGLKVKVNQPVGCRRRKRKE
jgi:hypothetical protein